MWKIIKQKEKYIRIKKDIVSLFTNWQFYIDFASDTFWPYEYKFGKFDCYYSIFEKGRWISKFPYKNKEFNRSELFLETDDIIVCCWNRTNLSWNEKYFIDIINVSTEKKQRLFVDEVNLIYNWDKEIIINANFEWIWKTVILDEDLMKIKLEKEEKLLANFKSVFNEKDKSWYFLKYNWKSYYLEKTLGNLNKENLSELDIFNNKNYIHIDNWKNYDLDIFMKLFNIVFIIVWIIWIILMFIFCLNSIYNSALIDSLIFGGIFIVLIFLVKKLFKFFT